MKKVLLLFLFIKISILGICQYRPYDVTQYVASSTTLLTVNGGLKLKDGTSGFINSNYPDTTHANLVSISTYNGATITTGNGDSTWQRYNNKWFLVSIATAAILDSSGIGSISQSSQDVYNFDLSVWNNKKFKTENKQVFVMPTHVDSIHGFTMADGYLWGVTRHSTTLNYLVRINPENLADTVTIVLPQFSPSSVGTNTYFGHSQITYVKSKDRLYIDCTNWINDTIRIIEVNPHTMAATFVINKPQYITTPNAAYNKAGQTCSATDGTYLYTLNGYYDPFVTKFDLTTYKAVDSVRIMFKGLGHDIMFDGTNLYASCGGGNTSNPVDWFVKLSTSPMAILNSYTTTDQNQGYCDDMASCGDYVYAGTESVFPNATYGAHLRKFSKKDLSFTDIVLGTSNVQSVSTDGTYVYAVIGNDTTLSNEIFRIDPITNTVLGHKFDTAVEKQPNEIISDGKRLWLTYFLAPAVVSRYTNMFFEDTVKVNTKVTKFYGNIYATNFNGLFSSSFSQSESGITTVTVPIGTVQSNTSYKLNLTPTSLLASTPYYVTNKTTTTFDVIYQSLITGTLTFDYSVYP